MKCSIFRIISHKPVVACSSSSKLFIVAGQAFYVHTRRPATHSCIIRLQILISIIPWGCDTSECYQDGMKCLISKLRSHCSTLERVYAPQLQWDLRKLQLWSCRECIRWGYGVIQDQCICQPPSISRTAPSLPLLQITKERFQQKMTFEWRSSTRITMQHGRARNIRASNRWWWVNAVWCSDAAFQIQIHAL